MSSTIVQSGNVFRSVYEPSTESLRVNLVGSGSPTMPNVVRLTDGTDYISSTVVGADRALDVNIVNAIELVLSHTDDSIRIGNGTNFLTTSTVGPKVAFDVSIASGTVSGTFTQAPSGATVVTYGFQTVASAATVTLCSYTIPAGNPVYLQRIYISGEAIGKYVIYKNASVLMVVRMSPTTFSQTIDLATSSAFGITTSPGDVISVEVENVTGNPAIYDATIQTMNT